MKHIWVTSHRDSHMITWESHTWTHHIRDSHTNTWSTWETHVPFTSDTHTSETHTWITSETHRTETHTWSHERLTHKHIKSRSRKRSDLKYLDFQIWLVFPATLLSDGDSIYSDGTLFEIFGFPEKTCLICTGTPVKTCWKFWQSYLFYLKSDLLHLWRDSHMNVHLNQNTRARDLGLYSDTLAKLLAIFRVF